MPPTRAARWMTRSARAPATAASACPGSVRSNSDWRGATTSAPDSCRRGTTTRPRKPEPPVTRTRRPDQKSLMTTCYGRSLGQHGRVRVAYTLEQCWHAVPGGTAVAALGMARALVERPEVELVGVAAWHRRPPPAPFVPPVPVRSLPLPRRALYEAWRRLGWPPVERATGPVDVVHATTILVPPRKASPLVVTVHDLAFRHDPGSFTRHGVHAFTAALGRIRGQADLVLCSSRATLDDAVAAGLDPAKLRLVPLGLDPVERPSAAAVDAVRRGLGLADSPYLLFVGTLEPRKNLTRLLEAYRSLGLDHQMVVVGPEGWGDE